MRAERDLHFRRVTPATWSRHISRVIPSTGTRSSELHAIGIEYFGDKPRLIDISLPDPGPGEVEVELYAASQNPLDESVAAGHLAGIGEFRFPLVLGLDGAGVVRRVGAGADVFTVGDRVFGQFWGDPMQFGTFAEAAVVPARPALGALRRIPEGVGFEAAAAAPTAGMTAAGALDSSRARRGDTILILGARGGVGTFAVQEAKARGIRVLAPAHRRVSDALRELGVDRVLPDDATLNEVNDGLGAVELAAVLDFAGAADSVEVTSRAVRDGGAVVSTAYGLPDSLRAQNRIAATDYMLDDKPARLDHLSARLAAGIVRPVITHEIALEDATRTLAPADDALRGKTVIRMH